jgi:hypothetical protein
VPVLCSYTVQSLGSRNDTCVIQTISMNLCHRIMLEGAVCLNPFFSYYVYFNTLLHWSITHSLLPSIMQQYQYRFKRHNFHLSIRSVACRFLSQHPTCQIISSRFIMLHVTEFKVCYSKEVGWPWRWTTDVLYSCLSRSMFLQIIQQPAKCVARDEAPELNDRGSDNVRPGRGYRTPQYAVIDANGTMMEL